MATEELSSTSHDEAVRENLYRAISSEVRDVTGGKIVRTSKELGRDIVEIVTEAIFRVAIREGYFRFPLGYGSIKVQRLKRDPAPKRLPTGEMVEVSPSRVKMRYEEGAAVREALGMPKHTNYQRRFERRSRLSKKATDLLNGAV